MIHAHSEEANAARLTDPTNDERIETRLYDLVADIRVPDDDGLFGDALAACPTVRVDPEYCRLDDASTLYFRANGDDLDAFERALADDETVTDVVVVSRNRDVRVYRARPLVDVPLLSALDDLSAHVCTRHIDGDGWWLRLHLPGRDALLAFNDYCRERGLDPNVARLGQGGGDAPGLTEAQRDLLQAAYEEGYYETPRDTSQAELASEFDVSPSSVSQRLRRATAELVENTLESGSIS